MCFRNECEEGGQKPWQSGLDAQMKWLARAAPEHSVLSRVYFTRELYFARPLSTNPWPPHRRVDNSNESSFWVLFIASCWLLGRISTHNLVKWFSLFRFPRRSRRRRRHRLRRRLDLVDCFHMSTVATEWNRLSRGTETLVRAFCAAIFRQRTARRAHWIAKAYREERFGLQKWNGSNILVKSALFCRSK